MQEFFKSCILLSLLIMAVAVPFTLGGKIMASVVGNIKRAATGLAKGGYYGLGKEGRGGVSNYMAAKSPTYKKARASLQKYSRQGAGERGSAERTSDYSNFEKAADKARKNGKDPKSTSEFSAVLDSSKPFTDAMTKRPEQIPNFLYMENGEDYNDPSKMAKRNSCFDAVSDVRNHTLNPDLKDSMDGIGASMGRFADENVLAGATETDSAHAEKRIDKVLGRLTDDKYKPKNFKTNKEWRQSLANRPISSRFKGIDELHAAVHSGNPEQSQIAIADFRKFVAQNPGDSVLDEKGLFDNSRATYFIDQYHKTLNSP